MMMMIHLKNLHAYAQPFLMILKTTGDAREEAPSWEDFLKCALMKKCLQRNADFEASLIGT